MAEIPLAADGDSVPTPAATVVPLRDGEDRMQVLLLRRNARGPFGGMWVFPGGKVDPVDEVGRGEVGGPDAEIGSARRAAVREAREEAGIDLDVSKLVTLSFWLPPPEAPRRFATWFFLGPSEPNHAVAVDQTEVHEHRWATPQDAIDSRNNGEIELAPPTFTTLWWLTRYRHAVDALAAAASRPPERFATRIATSADGLLATLWAGDSGYDDGDYERPGPRRRLVLDPRGWRVEVSGG